MGLFKSKAEKALTLFESTYSFVVADWWRQYANGSDLGSHPTKFSLLNSLHRSGLSTAAARVYDNLGVEVDPYYFDDTYFQLSCMRYGVEYSSDRVLFSARFGRRWIADGGPIAPTK